MTALNACVLSATRPLPSELAPIAPSHKDGVIRFFFHPAEVIRGNEGSEAPMAALPIEAAILQQYLEKYSKFETAVLSPSAPALGSYIVVSKTTKKSNMFGSLSCGFGAATLFILPYYDTSAIFSIRYDVLIDDQLKKTYSYEIKLREFVWWGSLPFF